MENLHFLKQKRARILPVQKSVGQCRYGTTKYKYAALFFPIQTFKPDFIQSDLNVSNEGTTKFFNFKVPDPVRSAPPLSLSLRERVYVLWVWVTNATRYHHCEDITTPRVFSCFAKKPDYAAERRSGTVK